MSLLRYRSYHNIITLRYDGLCGNVRTRDRYYFKRVKSYGMSYGVYQLKNAKIPARTMLLTLTYFAWTVEGIGSVPYCTLENVSTFAFKGIGTQGSSALPTNVRRAKRIGWLSLHHTPIELDELCVKVPDCAPAALTRGVQCERVYKWAAKKSTQRLKQKFDMLLNTITAIKSTASFQMPQSKFARVLRFGFRQRKQKLRRKLGRQRVQQRRLRFLNFFDSCIQFPIQSMSCVISEFCARMVSYENCFTYSVQTNCFPWETNHLCATRTFSVSLAVGSNEVSVSAGKLACFFRCHIGVIANSCTGCKLGRCFGGEVQIQSQETRQGSWGSPH